MERAVGRHSPEAVLEHLDWVQALARRLVADPGRAEDLGQEAALVAVRRPPLADRPLRAWLGGLVRNLARRERRGAARRREREAHAARGEALPSTLALVERAHAQRRVVEAVLALDEPYRTTVLLRWFEGLTPRQVARRSATPEATVKTRLRRALALLREALAGDVRADGSSWLSALVPFALARGAGLPTGAAASVSGAAGAASLPGAPGALVLGALAMNAKSVLVVACALLVGGGLWWGARSAPEASVAALAPAAAAAAPAERASEPADPVVVADVPGGAPARTALAAAPAASQPEPRSEAHGAPAPEATVRGRVVDLDGRALAGVSVRLAQQDGASLGSAKSGADGRFALGGARGPARLVVADERYAAVLDAHVGGARHVEEHVLVAAPRRAVAGRVEDEAGRPLAGVSVAYATAVDLRRRLEAVLDRSEMRAWSATSELDGSFLLAAVPELPEASVSASAHGRDAATVALPEQGDQSVRLVLPALVAGASGVVLGRVVDRRGDPVEGAWVCVEGGNGVRSDAEGRFQLEPWAAMSEVGAESGGARRLLALKQGSLPGSFERAEGEPWPAFVELVLGLDPLALSGRVVDEEGRGLAGVQIELADAGRVHVPLGSDFPGVFVMGSVEAMLRGEDVLQSVTTEAGGAFTIGGLLPRDYALALCDLGTLDAGEAGPFRAGAHDLEIVLRRKRRGGPLVGRVVNGRGEPLAGIQVQPQRDRGSEESGPVSGRRAETDAEGRFRFERLVYDGLRLGLFGGSIVTFEEHALEPGFDPALVTLVVRERCHFFVELALEPGRADAFSLLDGEGQPLPLYEASATMSSMRTEATLVSGRSEILSAREGPATLVLTKDDVEVQRLPIALEPGELNRVRL